MRKDIYTVAIMPSSGRRIRTFAISARGLVLMSVSIAVIFVSLITIGSYATLRYCRNKNQLANEAIQNSEVMQNEFERQLQQIRKSYSDFRIILGIEEEKPEDNAGKGGPKMPYLADIPAEDQSAADGIADEESYLLQEAVSLKSDLDDLIKIVDNRINEISTTPSIWPVKFEPKEQLWISSGFGRRRDPFTKRWTMHAGADIPAPRRTPIVSTADGTIAKMGRDAYLGNYIEVRHNQQYTTLYGHMDRFEKGIKKGTNVRRGDVIGYVGRTGRATGSHVHYEVRLNGKRVNPKKYILD